MDVLLISPDSCGSNAGTVSRLRNLCALTHSSMRLSPADGHSSQSMCKRTLADAFT